LTVVLGVQQGEPLTAQALR
jgi:magnesium-transporting ATPase (P-type)